MRTAASVSAGAAVSFRCRPRAPGRESTAGGRRGAFTEDKEPARLRRRAERRVLDSPFGLGILSLDEVDGALGRGPWWKFALYDGECITGGRNSYDNEGGGIHMATP